MKAVLLIVCVLLIVSIGVFLGPPMKTLPTAQCDQVYAQWIEARYREATSVKEGMTVADLQKAFTEDGGIQLPLTRRYILKSCRWIKIDVELDSPQGEERRFPPGTNVRIKKVSKPYLESWIAD